MNRVNGVEVEFTADKIVSGIDVGNRQRDQISADVSLMSGEVSKLRRENEQLRNALEQVRQELADFKSQQSVQHCADTVERKVDTRKLRHHDYLVAGFTVLLTLLIQNFPDVLRFAQRIVKNLFSAF